MDKPKLPPCRIIWESDVGPFCPECGSSQIWKWGFLGRLFGRSPIGCVNPSCSRGRTASGLLQRTPNDLALVMAVGVVALLLITALVVVIPIRGQSDQCPLCHGTGRAPVTVQVEK